MKIAVSAVGKSIESKVDQRFGRCSFFLLVELVNNKIKEVKAVKNLAGVQSGGAGIAASKFVAEQEVDVVLTGNLGPNALNVLKQFKIKAYCASGEIKQAINDFIENNLKEITETVQPHFGMEK